MFIQPIYNILLLQDVTYFFKKDFFGEKYDALAADHDILFMFLKEDVEGRNYLAEDFYPVGLLARIENISEEDVVQIRTIERVEILNPQIDGGNISAAYAVRPSVEDMPEEEQQEIFSSLRSALLRFVQGYQWGLWARGYILQRKNAYDLISSLSEYLNLSPEEKYQILSADSVRSRYELIRQAVNEFMEIAKVSAEAQEAQKGDQEQLYREAALKKQIDYLQKELDDMHPENVSDVRKFEKKIAQSGMNQEARREAEKILNRMRQEGKESHEYGLLYDYLDFVTSLSWKAPEFTPIDLNRAEQILDEDHYGLKKVKERIIQQLAVMALNRKQYGSILLFVGAPGTGKTSIGQSIARALGREYARISLGGIRDEAEIRGHRRTYVGAMPGRIMEAMKRSGVSNPVLVLDEVDKLAKDYGGDPASALLEVLDPEQNKTFTDHYLEVPFDLSKVLFITTANAIDTIPRPLLDRMEVIEVSGYTEEDKVKIARDYLIPKQVREHGLKKDSVKISENALRDIINYYTRESGVRNLEREIASICRKTARRIVTSKTKSASVTPKNLEKYLGKKKFHYDIVEGESEVGVVTGMAWTTVGGDTLSIEAAILPGSGRLSLTGQLGDVMQESAKAGVSYIRSVAEKLGIEEDFYKKYDLHIHVPEGAVPKDGPSAGVTMFTAVVSALTGVPVRKDIAMTGEITLRGKVLPVGGIREKVLAAHRAGARTILLPEENMKDVEEIPASVRKQLKFIPLKTAFDALDEALDRRENEDS